MGRRPQRLQQWAEVPDTDSMISCAGAVCAEERAWFEKKRRGGSDADSSGGGGREGASEYTIRRRSSTGQVKRRRRGGGREMREYGWQGCCTLCVSDHGL